MLVEGDGLAGLCAMAPTKMARRPAWVAPMESARRLMWEVVTSRFVLPR